MNLLLLFLSFFGSAQVTSDRVNLQLSFKHAPHTLSDGKAWYRFVRSLDEPNHVVAKVYQHASIEISVPKKLIPNYELHNLKRREQKAFLDNLFEELAHKKISFGPNTYTYHKVRVLSPGIYCCSNRMSNTEGYIVINTLTSMLNIEGIEEFGQEIIAEDSLPNRLPRFYDLNENAIGSDIGETSIDVDMQNTSTNLNISLDYINSYSYSKKIDRMIRFGLKVYKEQSLSLCYAFVKQMLSDGSKIVTNYPRGNYAYQALKYLPKEGFVNLLEDEFFAKVFKSPEDAPRGAILVYYRKNKPGHIEVRTRDGFLSDYYSIYPITKSRQGELYSLKGIFIKSNI